MNRILSLLLVLLFVPALAQTPGTTQYPTSLDTSTTLLEAKNNAQSTLASTLTSSATSLTLTSATTFPTSGVVSCESEIIYYTGKSGNNLTGLLRGQEGTTAASHVIGRVVRGAITATYHNALRAAIIALQTKVGAGDSTPGAGKVLGYSAGSTTWVDATGIPGIAVNTGSDPDAIKNNTTSAQVLLGSLDADRPTKTAAQIGALTAGRYGRELYQTDSLLGFKRDFGSSVGIKHALPFYTAYELGFVSGNSDSSVRTANSAAWTALVTAAPSTGLRVVFPEGTFYFATELSTTKPIILEGAGSAFVSGGTAFGTILVVESGENGIELLSGARGSEIRNLTIKTRSGYSGVSTGDGIYSDVTVKIQNVSIESFGRDGIYFNGTSPANTDFSSVANANIWGVKRDGLHYDGGNDTNVIYTANVNCTLNGRHGVYNAGSSNVFVGMHVSYSAEITGTGKDYYDSGSTNLYLLPYSENGTGSEYFYFDTGAVRSTVLMGLFGAPIFDAAAPGFYGKHTILEDGRWRDLLIRGTGDDGSDHDYELISRNIDAAGGLILNDATASARVFSYNPSGTTLTVPSLAYSGILKASGTPQTISGNGAITAINLTTDATLIVTTGAATTTLGAGAEGQFKTIKMKTDGGDCVATITNLLGGTTITFNDAGDFVQLRYLDGQWLVLQNSGCTIS